ncbi:carboxylesterase family protein [Shewanella maritima]|uniref:carboxylesterase family protein n=1 Tax=Shewanella maritima TaxID=2520507 RepID=UPI003736C345
MTTKLSIISLCLALFLMGCSGDDENNQTPIKPEPLEPGPTEQINVDLGFANITALKESVVVTRVDDEQLLVDIQSFKGIEYANSTRFQHSQLKPLVDEITATDFGFSCPQLKTTLQQQDENCLYLNMWRPDNTIKGDKLPVYVFIHGGDFEYGAGSEPLLHGDTVVAQNFDEQNPIIVVTLNYRLGALGSHWEKGENIDGNYGIGDQQRALEWVQTYIEDFGGDSTNVTLMGQGAGAMSISIHQQQVTQGKIPDTLFSQAIMQSNPQGFEYRTYKTAKSQDESLDLENASIEEILSKQANILGIESRLMSWLMASVDPLGTSDQKVPMGELMPFSPYVACLETSDGLLGHKCKVNDDQPYLADLAVPTVMGTNTSDAATMTMLPRLTFLIPKIIDLLVNDPDVDPQMARGELLEMLPLWLSDVRNQQLVAQVLKQEIAEPDLEMPTLPSTAYEAVTSLFFGLSNTSQTSQLMAYKDFMPNNEVDLSLALKNMAQFNTMMYDMMFMGPTWTKARTTNQSVSLYSFSYEPSFNVWAYNTKGEKGELDVFDLLKTISCISGACNGSELPFIFNKPLKLDGSSVSPSAKDLSLMAQLSRLWFSPALFKDYTYDSSDNVLVINGADDITPKANWDQSTQAGDDPSLSQGRLAGLEASGLLAFYLNSL